MQQLPDLSRESTIMDPQDSDPKKTTLGQNASKPTPNMASRNPHGTSAKSNHVANMAQPATEPDSQVTNNESLSKMPHIALEWEDVPVVLHSVQNSEPAATATPCAQTGKATASQSDQPAQSSTLVNSPDTKAPATAKTEQANIPHKSPLPRREHAPMLPPAVTNTDTTHSNSDHLGNLQATYIELDLTDLTDLSESVAEESASHITASHQSQQNPSHSKRPPVRLAKPKTSTPKQASKSPNPVTLGRPEPKTPKQTISANPTKALSKSDQRHHKRLAAIARKAKHRQAKRQQQRHFGWLRFAQAAGFSFAVLMLSGLFFLNTYTQNGGITSSGNLPSMTFLLAGRDVVYCYYRQPCKDQGQTNGLYQPPNTDTLMLVKLSEKGIQVLNIPRDTNAGDYDPTTSLAEQKINAQYWIGGPEYLSEKVEEMTGEHIDAYAVVRVDYVERVIDALGGLDVTVPAGGIEWVDQAAGVELNLTEGDHHLEGKEAVHYLRLRKGFGDDYGRIDHQKQAIVQLISNLKTPKGLLALPIILSGVDNGVETNLDPKLVSQIIPQLAGVDLQFATLPTKPIGRTYNLAVDPERLEAIWNPKTSWKMTEEIRQTYVTVWDATGQDMGSKMASALEALGFEKVTVKELSNKSENSQVFTHGGVAAADQLAQLLRLPRLQGERFPVGARGVGVLLGEDSTDAFAALLAAYHPDDPDDPNDSTDATDSNTANTNAPTSQLRQAAPP